MPFDLCEGLVGLFFCFQAEDGIRDLVRSRGLGDVYKRQVQIGKACIFFARRAAEEKRPHIALVCSAELVEILSLIHI